MKSVSFPPQQILYVLLLPLAVCLLYSNTLDVPFVFDDAQIFEHAPAAAAEGSIEGFLSSGAQGVNRNRVLPNLSFAVNYRLHGMEVTGYHWVNIGVHACAALTLFFLLRLVLSLLPTGAGRGLHSEIAFVSALLWALHPLQTNAVTYIIQRMTSMAALFYLLSILCYLKARLAETMPARLSFFCLAGVWGVLALFSKENAAMLPVMIAASEFYLFNRGDPGSRAGRNRLISLGLLAIFVVCSFVFLGKDPWARIMEGYTYREFTPWERLLTEPRVILYYLGLLVLPLPSRLNIAHDFPLSTGLLTPVQTGPAIVLLGLFTAAVVLLFKRQRFLSFALAWFLLNLVIESSIIPLMIIFEHRMYLPSIFLIAAGVLWCYRLAGEKVGMARAGVGAVILLFALFSWQRNMVWQSGVSLWTDVVAKSPGLSWARANLGKAYAEIGEYASAEEQLRKAIALNPGGGLGYQNLGVMYEKQGRLPEANFMLNKALERSVGDSAKLHVNLAVVQFKLGNLELSVRHAQQAIKEKPGRYKAHDILGMALVKGNRLGEAEQVFLQAAQRFPHLGAPLARLALVYEKQNRLQEAVDTLSRALEQKEVGRARVCNQLGIVFWKMGNLKESIRYASRAVELDPELLDAYLTLGISLEDAGQQENAFTQFTRAWQKGYDMVGMYNNWAGHHLGAGNPDRALLYLQEAVRLDPGRVESHRNLARAYAAKGMGATAAREEQMVRQLAP